MCFFLLGRSGLSGCAAGGLAVFEENTAVRLLVRDSRRRKVSWVTYQSVSSSALLANLRHKARANAHVASHPRLWAVAIADSSAGLGGFGIGASGGGANGPNGG